MAYDITNGYVTDAQSTEGFGKTFNPVKKAPVIANRIFDTYEHALAYVNANTTCIPGLILSVFGDVAEKNGIYQVVSVGTPSNKNGQLKKDGSANAEDITAIYDEISNIISGVGLESDGSYKPSSTAVFIKEANSVAEAIATLDNIANGTHNDVVALGNVVDALIPNEVNITASRVLSAITVDVVNELVSLSSLTIVNYTENDNTVTGYVIGKVGEIDDAMGVNVYCLLGNTAILQITLVKENVGVFKYKTLKTTFSNFTPNSENNLENVNGVTSLNEDDEVVTFTFPYNSNKEGEYQLATEGYVVSAVTGLETTLQAQLEGLEDKFDNFKLVEIVQRLPKTGDSNKIYLLPLGNEGEEKELNVYEEYIWITDQAGRHWELIGKFHLDSDTVTKLITGSTSAAGNYVSVTTNVSLSGENKYKVAVSVNDSSLKNKINGIEGSIADLEANGKTIFIGVNEDGKSLIDIEGESLEVATMIDAAYPNCCVVLSFKVSGDWSAVEVCDVEYDGGTTLVLTTSNAKYTIDVNENKIASTESITFQIESISNNEINNICGKVFGN